MTRADYIIAAFEVVLGRYGEGEKRREILKNMGYDDKIVQDIVNIVYKEVKE